MNSPLKSRESILAAVLKNYYDNHIPIFNVSRPIEPQEVEIVELRMPKRAKSNSLKHICSQILKKYSSKVDIEVHLNEFSAELGVERRRIYDIVNILEGFDIFAKKKKNVYIWKGFGIFFLKLKILESFENSADDNLKLFRFEKSQLKSKKKSLTYLSIRFLRHLSGGTGEISFKNAISKFAREIGDDKRATGLGEEDKNIVRRLYDIVNVFKAMGLIRKEQLNHNKEDFYWKGAEGMAQQIKELEKSENRFEVEEHPLSTVANTDQNLFNEKMNLSNIAEENITLKTSGFSIVKGRKLTDMGKLKMTVEKSCDKENLLNFFE